MSQSKQPINLATRAQQLITYPGLIPQVFTTLDREKIQSITKDEIKKDSSSEALLQDWIFSIKANIDVKGWVTHAGSKAFEFKAPATKDAVLVQALKAMGAYPLAQSNMTEFAYGALGVNRYFGTPFNLLFPHEKRVAGGSSSGGAIGVALGLTDAALCTDTSGSARIPATFCGVVGLCLSRQQWPMTGFFPLSSSFDRPGVMTQTVKKCEQVFNALSRYLQSSTGFNLEQDVIQHEQRVTENTKSPRLCIPINLLRKEPIDSRVEKVFNRVVNYLEQAGWHIDTKTIVSLEDIGEKAAQAGIIAAEAFAIHQEYLEHGSKNYDPWILKRILNGANVLAWSYRQALDDLAEQSQRYHQEIMTYDAILTPTSALTPPKLSELDDDARYLYLNRRSYLFTEIANRLDLPSISLPISRYKTDQGIGILLTGKTQQESQLILLARQLEQLLKGEHNDC